MHLRTCFLFFFFTIDIYVSQRLDSVPRDLYILNLYLLERISFLKKCKRGSWETPKGQSCHSQGSAGGVDTANSEVAAHPGRDHLPRSCSLLISLFLLPSPFKTRPKNHLGGSRTPARAQSARGRRGPQKSTGTRQVGAEVPISGSPGCWDLGPTAFPGRCSPLARTGCRHRSAPCAQPRPRRPSGHA